MKRSIRTFPLLFILLMACGSDKGSAQNEPSNSAVDEAPSSFAQGFKIEDKGTHRELVMIETAQDLEFARYYLVNDDQEVPEGADTNFVIHTPVRSIACGSTTHASFISAIDRTDAITGLAYAENVMDPPVAKAFSSGQIEDVTGANDIDIEKLIALNPELVIVYPSMAGVTDDLWQAGIQVMLFAEHSEPHPLGRMEWVKVVGAILNDEESAQSYVDEVTERYIAVKNEAMLSSHIPLVFFGSAWKGVWEAPGGRSASSQLLRDAAAKYLFDNNESVRGMQVDFEVLLDKGYLADYWGMMIAGDPNEFINEMDRNDPRMVILKPVQERKIFYCNTLEADYFGRAMVEPDVLLSDLIHLVHPGYLPEHEPIYFRMIDQ